MAHDRLRYTGVAVASSLVTAVALARWMRGLSPLRADLVRRQYRGEAPGTVRLTVVVPAYMEQDRIGHTVARLKADLDTLAAYGGLEVLVVDDGSTDDTAAVAEAAGADRGHPPGEPGQGRRGALGRAGGQRSHHRLHRRRPRLRPRPDPGPRGARRAGLGRRGRQPSPHRHHHPRAGPSPAGDRRAGDQPAHPGRAARPVPRHPVRAEGVPLRRGPADLRPHPGRRLRVRRRGLPPRRALPPLAGRGPGAGRELGPLHRAGSSATRCAWSATCSACASGRPRAATTSPPTTCWRRPERPPHRRGRRLGLN